MDVAWFILAATIKKSILQYKHSENSV